MSNLANNQNNLQNLLKTLKNPRNKGEEIELVFALAENHPEEAVRYFASILESQALPTKRALALRGLGIAAQTSSKVKLALSTDEEILKEIVEEIQGNNDLARWAAAWAIEAMGFDEDAIHHLEGGALTDPLYRIRNEILSRKFEAIRRIENNQNFDPLGNLDAEYERLLEFWIYGLTEKLFEANLSSYPGPNQYQYQNFVTDVIDLLHIRGVYLGLGSQNFIPQEAALNKANQIFKESDETEDRLYPYIKNYLINPNYPIQLRVKSAEIIGKASTLRRK